MSVPLDRPARGSVAHPWRRRAVEQRGPRPDAVRQPAHAVSSERDLVPHDIEWLPHEHPVHELLWSSSGVIVASIGERRWALPPKVALWIPAGVMHAGLAPEGTGFHAAYFDPVAEHIAAVTALLAPGIIRLTPLLHELLVHLVHQDLAVEERRRAEALVADLLRPGGAEGELIVPEDPRIAPVVRGLLSDPADARRLEDWALEVGCSPRTLARAFDETVGVGFQQWRTSVRVQAAMSLLLAGMPVGEVAEVVGYETPSGFTAAFRASVGVTPSRFTLTAAMESTGR